jgi:hypothetical protein
MVKKNFLKVVLCLLFLATIGGKEAYCQIQRQVNSSTITKTTCAVPSYIDEDSISALDIIAMEYDDLEKCTEQVINAENELTVIDYYPQQPRWENDYQYMIGKSVTSKDGTVLYDHEGNEYYRLDSYNPDFILSQYEIEDYGVFNGLFDIGKEELIELLQMSGFEVSEQDGFIIASFENIEIAINLDELIVETRFFGEEDNEFFAEEGNKLEMSDRRNYIKVNNYIVPVKNIRVHYSTLPSGIPYEITEEESYLFYQVINKNNSIVKTGNESIFNNCVTNSVTGIETIQQQTTELKIYPNPTNGTLHVTSYALHENTVIELFDIYGKNLLSIPSILYHETTIDIIHLAYGMYFMKITTNENTIIKKIVKQ